MLTPEELISKYNVPVPRYTSYPPANYFTANFSATDYEQAMIHSNREEPRHLSFYIHIPFCRHLCHYCGCNSIGRMEPGIIDRYVETLHTEIDGVTALLDRSRKISQIHYGGGSPTILPAGVLRELNEHLMSSFPVIEQPEIAIECHPGYLNEQQWLELTRAGFNRFSIGIQDLDPNVLKVVNRKPPLVPVQEIFTILREQAVRINLDLLYGLPLQTVDSFRKTVDQAVSLSPDRLVTFSYGHVPHVNPRQRMLEKLGFPVQEEKKGMFEMAKKNLLKAGYKTIGLDHFVREEDELWQAFQMNALDRNFQGYCSKRITGQVYAFGMSGISQLNNAYIQNSKDLHNYMEQIRNGKWAVAKGYILNRQEQITRRVIQSLMCNYSLDLNRIAAQMNCPLEEVKQAIAWHEDTLKDFQQNGLISYSDTTIRMTSAGDLFVRNVAASLDKLMDRTTKSYSKPV